MKSLAIEHILQKEFSYFRNLTHENRTVFISRVKKFISSKSFEGRKKLIVTDEMKVLIAATAIQLTFGFSNYYNYEYFDRIILYPEKYYSSHTGLMHTGEMNTGGLLVFSWKDFYDGIKTDNDSRNVGIHEFAHALDFMSKAQLGMDDYFAFTIEKIKVHGRHFIHEQSDKPFFRSYAATNTREFFAVATEYFFEAPKEFRNAMPELYNLFCLAYSQSPQPKVLVKNNYSKQFIPLNKTNAIYSKAQIYSAVGLSVFMLLQMLYWFVFRDPFLMNENNSSAFFILYFLSSLVSIILFFSNMFKRHLEFYENKIRVYFTPISVLLRGLFFIKENSYRDVPIENVLQMYIDEYEIDYYEENNLFQQTNYIARTEVISKVTCSYLYNEKIKHATCRVDSLSLMKKLYNIYFNEYKIAIIENGHPKKIDIL